MPLGQFLILCNCNGSTAAFSCLAAVSLETPITVIPLAENLRLSPVKFLAPAVQLGVLSLGQKDNRTFLSLRSLSATSPPPPYGIVKPGALCSS